MTLHKGSCHCGKVAYEIETDLEQVIECNCSICSRRGYLLTFVSRGALNVIRGEENLSTYTFNTHTPSIIASAPPAALRPSAKARSRRVKPWRQSTCAAWKR